MDVITKLKRISTPAKIGIALGGAVLLGGIAYLIVGPETAAASGLGGLVVAALGLRKGRRKQPPGAIDRAEEDLEQTRRDADRETREAVATGRESIDAHAAELEDHALDTARDSDLGATLRRLGREGRDVED